MSSNRPERVGEAIRDELSQLIAREVHDPGVGFVTLTRVKVSPDLQIARAYYTLMGDEKARRDTARALTRATPFLRRQLGQRIRLRRVPELEFFYDESIANQDRIERILQELKAETESRGDGATAPEPRARSGDPGASASERVGESGGAKPPGLENDDDSQ
ncbi:MAG: 30S ribosome-binding factor RbfA [Vicinamibacterales bacterium]